MGPLPLGSSRQKVGPPARVTEWPDLSAATAPPSALMSGVVGAGRAVVTQLGEVRVPLGGGEVAAPMAIREGDVDSANEEVARVSSRQGFDRGL